jgi:hypothetical protein
MGLNPKVIHDTVRLFLPALIVSFTDLRASIDRARAPR